MNLMVEKGAVRDQKRVIRVENMNVWIAAMLRHLMDTEIYYTS